MHVMPESNRQTWVETTTWTMHVIAMLEWGSESKLMQQSLHGFQVQFERPLSEQNC